MGAAEATNMRRTAYRAAISAGPSTDSIGDTIPFHRVHLFVQPDCNGWLSDPLLEELSVACRVRNGPLDRKRELSLLGTGEAAARSADAVRRLMLDRWGDRGPPTQSEGDHGVGGAVDATRAALGGLRHLGNPRPIGINEAFRDDDFEAMRVAAGIPDSLLLDRDGEPVLVHGQQVRGITVCNIPVGSAGFVETYLTRKQDSIIGDNDMIKALLDPRRWAQPEIPTRQLAFLMLRNCLQFRGDYWLRHLPPQLTATFAKELDDSTWGFLEHALGDELSNWTNLGIRRLQLPVRRNGGGFRSCNSRKDAQGNVIPGRMHTPSLVNHFGETSFNHARDRDWHPWRHLLDNSNGDIATGLRQASSQMKTNFEEVAIDGMYDQDSCLVLQDVTRFGFNSDGTRPTSVTHALTVQLETMEFRWLLQQVRALPTSRFDRWAFECCDVFSQQVMLAAPDAMGHMGNEAFVIAVTRYFGQSSYITRSMAGLYFGKKGEQVNENATNLCCAHLPGGGFRILHDQVKTLIITFLRLAGVEADEESALWMLAWEGTIVADFVARDFPVPTQASNDSGLGARTDVLGEVKTLQPSKSSYDKGSPTARQTGPSTYAPPRPCGATGGAPPASTKSMHKKLSGTARTDRLAHSRRHWESFTQAMLFLLLSARLVKSMKTLVSSLQD
ncbi:hypothetical protein THAOC_00002 [Thalassiosira oceanica]|uniref:Uncharacterized protein n=1 Tax=Thalassiosira oceanica TaxID=159749 RepID=K0TK98_THAOC|nr:hypothetical protein THAOC_00002 [Thalassiosira oceanica]|eukprot:EJK78115.1 hypothetical protein THAOC_00002 [Thalassiosira oceanica]